MGLLNAFSTEHPAELHTYVQHVAYIKVIYKYYKSAAYANM